MSLPSTKYTLPIIRANPVATEPNPVATVTPALTSAPAAAAPIRTTDPTNPQYQITQFADGTYAVSDPYTGQDSLTGTNPYGGGQSTEQQAFDAFNSMFGVDLTDPFAAPTPTITPAPVVAAPPAAVATTPVNVSSAQPATTTTDVNTPSTATATPATTPASATSTTSGTTSTTSATGNSALLTTLLSDLASTSGTGDTTSGTVPSDVDALNAAAPTVTGSAPSTSTAGPSLEVFGIIAAIAIAGVGWYVWHKHHANGGAPPPAR